MVTGNTSLQPGVDPEAVEYCRRMRLDRVLASSQMRRGRPDVHPGGQATENGLLARGQFTVVLKRSTKPR